MGIAKITRNFQITLPKDVRKVVDVKEGDEVLFVIADNKVFFVKSKEDPIMAAAGILKGTKETGAEYQRKMRQQWRKRQKKLGW